MSHSLQDFVPINEARNRARAIKKAAEDELNEIKSNWLRLLGDVALGRTPEKTLAKVRARRVELETILQEHPAVLEALDNEDRRVSAGIRLAERAERDRKAKQERSENLGAP